MSSVGKFCLVMAIICCIICGAWATVRAVKSVQFSHECEAYLKRAADANTVEMAKEELAKAIDYAERHNLTDGIVSIIFHNPKNDVGFWYDNMKACYQELENLPEDATALEKTNMLMKLRESLLDSSGESGTRVTIPEGITVYPNNVAYCLWGLLSFIAACIFLIGVCVSDY